mgnify:CR=1 FL=1
MKRYLSLFLALVMLGGIFALPVSAAPAVETSETTVEYFEDGSYIVTTITETGRGARSSTKSGSKSTHYYNSKDEEQWVATIHGTFSYDGYSATCTGAYTSHTIYNSAWKLKSSSSEKSGNQAIGHFVFKYYLLGVPINTIEKTVVLTCSPNGVLS